MNWKQKIEAQIEYLTTMLCVQFQQRSRPSISSESWMLAESIESLKLLLDVAVAAEKMADFIVDYDGCDGGVWREFWDALDKLREADDE